MKSPLGSLPAPRWRAEGAPRLPLRARGGRASGRFALLLAGWLLCLGGIGALLALLRPLPRPHFAPFCITAYASPTLAASATAARDQEQLCAVFERVTARTWTAPQRGSMVQQLDDLAALTLSEDAVVYLSGHALVTETGEVAILPADAVPDDPRTWLPLTDVLRHLARCPARRQLLVLDIAHAGLLPRWGVPDGEVARAIPAALAAVPDERRLVLCACAPGQVAQVSEVLGQSAFAHYLEEGLRGRADGYRPEKGTGPFEFRGPVPFSGRRDGRISARELTAFVQARVERWALLNRGVRQTPELFGTGEDFPLAAVTKTAAAPRKVYAASPDWLREARADAERLLDNGDFQRNPRTWQQLQTLIADTERSCRFVAEPASLASSFLKQCDRLRGQSPAAAFPTAFSLTLQMQHDAPPSPAARQLQESICQIHDQWRRAKPAEGARLQERFLGQWPLTTRTTTAQERDAAVVQWLVQQGPLDPSSVRWADALLRAGSDAEPRHGEALAIRLLADLAGRISASAWSGTHAQQVLALARLAEQPLRHPQTFAWCRDELEQALQRKHEGEIALWSSGYVPRQRAEQLLRDAELQLLELHQQAESLTAIWELSERATVLLPAYVPILDVQPELRNAWIDAVRVTTALLDERAQPPIDPAVRRLTRTRLDENAGRLRELLAALREPFVPDRIERLIQLSRTSAGPPVLRELETLRDAGPGWLPAQAHASLEKAAAALALRLHEATSKLDRADDIQKHCTATMAPAPADTAPLSQAAARIQCEIALLEMGGVTKDRLAPLHDAGAKLTADNQSAPAWAAWGQALRDLYAVGIPEQLARARSLVRKERLSRFIPAREPTSAFDAGAPLALQVRRQEVQAAWTWLAGRYRYQARDYAGLGLDTPGMQTAQRFYADAAAHAALPPEAATVVRMPTPVQRLHAGQLSTTTSLALERIVPAGKFGPTQVQIVLPDSAWLDVTPTAIELPGVKNTGATQTLTTQVPLRIGLRDGAERSQTPAPLGFLAVARADGRAFHHLVPVPLQVTAQEVAVLLSSNPKEPQPNLDEVRLRPGNVRQSFFVYLQNLTPRSRTVSVELLAGGGLVPGGKTRVTLRPGQTERIAFHDAPTPLDAKPLPDCHSPLEMRVFDAEQNQAPLAVRRFPVVVAQPRDYVRIADTQIEPAPLAAERRVSVSLQTWTKVPGPGIPAQLVLPASRSAKPPDLSPERELSNQPRGEPVALSAETSRGTGDDDHPIYVTVDGVPRAFIFHSASGQRSGSLPHHDDRLAMRIRAAASMTPSARVPVTVEVDNAPPGARLEFAVLQSNGSVELVRRYSSAQQHRLGFTPHGPDGALVFEAAINDWTMSLDTGAWQGRRVFKARIINEFGRELQHSLHELIVDATPPEDVAFVAPPAQAQRGTTLKVVARGFDRDSDIAQVFFFIGRPTNDQPLPNTPKVAGFAADLDHGLWGGSIPLPADHKGPLPISVQFINRAGLARCATTTVELLDVDPATLRPGAIAGKVLEGPRPQPGLTVVLRDEHGQDKARTRTQPDGTFQFDNLAPGKYQLFCDKPESGRRVLQAITISPGGAQRVHLALAL